MFKIDNEQDLVNVLKIFAEESVKKAKKTLNETVDMAQDRYRQNLARDESRYGVNLDEQEKEENPEEKEEAPPEEEVPEEAEEEKEEVTPETLGVSFDSVLKDINTLRAGRSTKDKEIKDELLGYYDRLDDDERQISRWLKLAGPNGRFRRTLMNKIIKEGSTYDDFSISPVIRQVLLHWGYQLTNKDLTAYKKSK